LQAWVEARKASDFSIFAPYLQQWVDLNKQKAKHIDPTADPYDVLLDDYEKGMTSKRLDEIFDEVRCDRHRPPPCVSCLLSHTLSVNHECVFDRAWLS
jgi:carboxypeptidase Taq